MSILVVLMATLITGLIIIAIIIGVCQINKARVSAVNKISFEQLANELKAENAKILSELTVMKENLSSMNKMMKEIE